MGVYWAEIADQDQTKQQIQFLKQHLKPEDTILDLACGTGRHSIPLSRQGYEMVGLDVSVKLLKIAKKRSRQLQVVRGDMRFLPFKTQTFAAAISMDTSLGYLPSEFDDAQSLSEAQRILGRHGVLVVDVFNRENLTAKYHGKTPEPKPKKYPSFFLQQNRTISYDGDWLCDSWAIRDKTGGQTQIFEHTVRLYRLERLQRLLENAGFVINQVIGGYDDERFDSDSKRLILIAKSG